MKEDASPLNGVALVTGASRGLGRAIALRLADDGLDIAVNSATSSELGEEVVREVEARGRRSHYVQADVRHRIEVESMLETVRKRLGPVAVVVNNAGWMRPQPFEDDDEEHWDRILDTKVKGALYLVAGALPDLKQGGWGKIINITGDSGRVGNSRGAVHSAGQGALQSLTKSWAREFAEFGIRVNAVSPGPIRTEQEREFATLAPEVHASELWGPFGVGEPEDIAAAVAFLVRHEGDHITGQILSVNGGRAYPS